MSLEQLEAAIRELPQDQREQFALWFEENRRELLGNESDELSEEQKTEILRRRDLVQAHPELLQSWDGTIERVRTRLNEFRRQDGFRQLSRTPSKLRFGTRSENLDSGASFSMRSIAQSGH